MSCNFGCYYCACIACIATLVGPAISVEVVTTFALQIFAVPRCAIEIGAHFSSVSLEQGLSFRFFTESRQLLETKFSRNFAKFR